MDELARKRLQGDLVSFVEADPAQVDEARFSELALRLWRWHTGALPAYRRFCVERAGTLERVTDWRAIPPLPVEAFKLATLACAPEAGFARAFTTSGTTGRGRVGTAWFAADDLEVMDAAVRMNAGRSLFADGARCRILVLAPPPDAAPHVIMAYGMRVILETFGTPESEFLIGAGGLDEARLFAALADVERTGEPICLIGASFGFVHLLDRLDALGRCIVPLPPGSRIMDAGGYKGRSRELTPAEFRAAVCRRFAVPEHAVVNLLGMTELASQIYDRTPLASGAGPAPRRCKLAPHWLRTRVLSIDDPTRDAADGERGFLAHWDLANFSRPIAILSDDLGVRDGDAFQIVGRVRSSEARGCSLKVDELLAARP